MRKSLLIITLMVLLSASNVFADGVEVNEIDENYTHEIYSNEHMIQIWFEDNAEYKQISLSDNNGELLYYVETYNNVVTIVNLPLGTEFKIDMVDNGVYYNYDVMTKDWR